MAYETLGINLIVKGMSTVARDVSHVATSFGRFINAADKAERSVLRFAQSQERVATAAVTKTQVSIDRLITKYVQLSDKSTQLARSISIGSVAQSGYNKVIDAYIAKAKTVAGVETAAINAARTYAGETDKRSAAAQRAKKELLVLIPLLTKEKQQLESMTPGYTRAAKAVQKYTDEQEEYIDISEEIFDVVQKITGLNREQVENILKQTDAQKKLNDILNEQQSDVGGVSKAISALTKGYGDTITQQSGLIKILGLTQPQLAAVALGLDLMKLAMNGVIFVGKILVGALKLVWNVLKSILSVVWDVVKWVGEKLWSAFKKVIALPFNVIKKAFEGIGSTVRQAFSWLVGMNIDRIMWGLAAKFRELTKTAAEAAMEFQVTFIRLRGLMTGEIMNMTGASYADSLGQATIQAKELVTWVSKLAVLTIFDADDILSVTTLAMAYGFTSENAKNLTESVLDFATGMGLEDVAMRRIIENFGQLRAQGKITGTELRDLARGSFVPVNDVLEQMAKNVGLVGDYDVPNLKEITDVFDAMLSNKELSVDGYEKIQEIIKTLGKDGKITRVEFETLAEQLSKAEVMRKFGLSAEDAGKALEGIKTGKLTAELNQLIKTGKISIDEFFEAFVEMTENRFPNAAMSMSMSMKTVMSNLGDFLKTMVGWRLLAPVFEVIAENLSATISGWMSDENIRLFDRLGLAFKKITKVVFRFGDGMWKSMKKSLAASRLFSSTKSILEGLAMVIGSFGDIEGWKKGIYTSEFYHEFLKPFSENMAPERITRVVDGLVSLNDAFNKITRTDTFNIKEMFNQVKNAIIDIAVPIWEDIIKPELVIVWDNIKKFIVDKWINDIVPAFQAWKTEKLLPWLDEFINVTIPNWILALATNGPTLLGNISTWIGGSLEELHNLATQYTGEDSAISLLIGLLESLAKWAGMKLNPIVPEGWSDVGLPQIDGTGLEEMLDFTVGNPFEDSGLEQSLIDIRIAGEELINKVFTPIADWLDKKRAPLEGLGATLESIGKSLSIYLTTWTALGDFFTAIGKLMTTPVGKKETKSTQESLQGILDMILMVGSIPAGVATTALDIVTTIITFLDALSEAVIAYYANFGNEDQTFFQEIGSGFGILSDEFSKAFPEGKTFENLIKVADNIKYFINSIWGVKDKIDDETFVDKLIEFFSQFGKGNETEDNSGDNVRNMGANIVKGVAEGMTGEQQTAIDAFNDIISGITSGGGGTAGRGRETSTTTTTGPLYTHGQNLISGLIGGMNSKSGEVQSTFNTIASSIKIPGALYMLYSTGQYIIQGFWNGLKEKWGSVEVWWSNVVLALEEMIRKLMGIRSPSRVMYKMGENLAEGLRRGIVTGMKKTSLSVRMEALDIQQAIGALRASDIERNYYSTVTSNYNFNVTSHSSTQTLIQQYEVLRAMAG